MSPAPDFLRPTRRPHRLAWASFVTALAVLLVAGLEAREAAARLAEAEAPRPAPPPPAAPAALPDTTAQRALDEALARLARPWPASFRSLEAVQGRGLAWLSLRIDETGALHLEGQAADSAAAQQAALLLRRQGTWRDVVLGRMERAADGPLSFEIQAAWAGAPP